jgi:hypothetical protein
VLMMTRCCWLVRECKGWTIKGDDEAVGDVRLLVMVRSTTTKQRHKGEHHGVLRWRSLGACTGTTREYGPPRKRSFGHRRPSQPPILAPRSAGMTWTKPPHRLERRDSYVMLMQSPLHGIVRLGPPPLLVPQGAYSAPPRLVAEVPVPEVAQLSQVPMCLVSLVDEKRQWFKSHLVRMPPERFLWVLVALTTDRIPRALER